MDEQQVLRLPFDITVHKQTFVEYLEVLITEDGTVLYATPSHQERLIQLACEKLQITRKELNDLCPPEYYFDFMNWLCQITNCIAVWNGHMVGKANTDQVSMLKLLQQEQLYKGPIYEKQGCG